MKVSLSIMAMLLATTVSANGQTTDRKARLLDTINVPVRFDSAGGYRIAYYETGPAKAPVVVLIPTIRWSAHSWAQNIPALARSYHVIAIDPLGTGLSDKPLIDFKMKTWTDGFAEVLRRKGIDQAVFVGTEMGGALSVQMALDHPQYVRAIVVAASNSGPGPHEGAASRTGGLTPEGVRAGLLLEFNDSSLITESVVQTLLNRRLNAGDRHTIQNHLADHRPPYSVAELSSIRVPALFVWCKEDRITPLSWGRDFAAPLPHSQFRVIDGCGHYPNLEQPDRFNQSVVEFLQQISRR